MVTVPEAARRAGRHPETIRRWIREGKLRSEKIGTQHLIDEADLDQALEEPDMLPLPKAWRRLPSGDPVPNWVAAIRRSRQGH